MTSLHQKCTFRPCFTQPIPPPSTTRECSAPCAADGAACTSSPESSSCTAAAPRRTAITTRPATTSTSARSAAGRSAGDGPPRGQGAPPEVRAVRLRVAGGQGSQAVSEVQEPLLEQPSWHVASRSSEGEEQTSKGEGRPMKLDTFRETAMKHEAADFACGRAWSCACVACQQIRPRVWLHRVRRAFIAGRATGAQLEEAKRRVKAAGRVTR